MYDMFFTSSFAVNRLFKAFPHFILVETKHHEAINVQKAERPGSKNTM